jgi:DNA-binding NtrC family response regulator
VRSYLIVDDNAAFAENLAEILADAGAEAVVADSGERALALVRSKRFDAMVCDMRMPVMSGAQVVHQVRRIDPGLPALVVTAYTADNELEAARQEGLLAVLPKPVPIARLMELLKSARRDGLIALVEDDAAFADNLAEALRDRGFAAVTAASVIETERLGDVRPFMALVDLRLPGGPDGAAMQRLAQKYPRLPQVVLTAHLHSAPPIESKAVFQKPFDTAKLLEYVEELHRSQPTHV